jgi:hypothetical protein
MNKPIKMIPPEDRPDVRSYAEATWLDVNNVEHIRYVIHPMNPGPGFWVIDTYNNANSSVRANFATAEDAQEFLRTTPAP